MVISPCELRPPVRFFGSTSDFSGVCLVISLLSSMVIKRRDAVYGLKLFSAIVALFPGTLAGPCCEPPALTAKFRLRYKFSAYSIIFSFGRELHVSLLPVAPVPFGAAAAAELSVINRRAHGGHLHLENLSAPLP